MYVKSGPSREPGLNSAKQSPSVVVLSSVKGVTTAGLDKDCEKYAVKLDPEIQSWYDQHAGGKKGARIGAVVV